MMITAGDRTHLLEEYLDIFRMISRRHSTSPTKAIIFKLPATTLALALLVVPTGSDL